MKKLQHIAIVLGGAAIIAALTFVFFVVVSQPNSMSKDQAIEIIPSFPKMVRVFGAIESIEGETLFLRVSDSSIAGLDTIAFFANGLPSDFDINVGDEVEISFERAQLDTIAVWPAWVKIRGEVFYMESRGQLSEAR